ncbi:MAG TPA: hypothetical protein VNU66_09675 [Mycobacteriales bacterium]|nr:hypothetical protein [Mycobacteriales bacterium]
MRTRPVLAVAVTAAAAALSATALAAPGATTIGSVTAASAGTQLVVTAAGTAAFDGALPRADVGGTLTPFAQADLAKAAGTDLRAAFIEELEDGSGLRFTWDVSSLPAQVPPEGVRYTWAFQAGDAVYQLQAKRTNLVATSIADDPASHVTSAASGAFQIRGNCGNLAPVPEAPTNVSSCPSLAFLPGGFDTAAGEVFLDLAYDTAFAPEVTKGVVLREAQVAATSIGASFQAGISNATTTQSLNGWSPYYTGPSVSLGVASATTPGQNVTYVPATVDGEDWTGSLSVRRTASTTTLFVRTCEGATGGCSYTSAPLS